MIVVQRLTGQGRPFLNNVFDKPGAPLMIEVSDFYIPCRVDEDVPDDIALAHARPVIAEAEPIKQFSQFHRFELRMLPMNADRFGTQALVPGKTLYIDEQGCTIGPRPMPLTD